MLVSKKLVPTNEFLKIQYINKFKEVSKCLNFEFHEVVLINSNSLNFSLDSRPKTGSKTVPRHFFILFDVTFERVANYRTKFAKYSKQVDYFLYIYICLYLNKICYQNMYFSTIFFFFLSKKEQYVQKFTTYKVYSYKYSVINSEKLLYKFQL